MERPRCLQADVQPSRQLDEVSVMWTAVVVMGLGHVVDLLMIVHHIILRKRLLTFCKIWSKSHLPRWQHFSD